MAEHLSLPDSGIIRSLPVDQREAILDLLFEPCATLHRTSGRLLADRTFGDYDELIGCVGTQLDELAASSSSAVQEQLDAILSAHPRLGEKKTGAQSSAEQAQLHTGAEEERVALARCNEDYEKAFPGLRYV